MMISDKISINSNQPTYKAKFIKTNALQKVAEWAVDNNKFEELNKARKNIDYSATKIRIYFDLGTTVDGYPIAIFQRYYPRDEALKKDVFAKEDFILSRPVVYTSINKINPFEYGCYKIIQLGNMVTKNRMFREIVIRPPKYTDL